MDTRRIILVIDDDEGMRRVIERSLVDEYEIDLASSGEEGLRKIERLNPHLVLLDLKMPGVGGLSVLRRLKDIERSIPVMIITSYGNVGSAVQAMKLGAVDYIEKPFCLEKLKRTIRQLFSLRERPLEELPGCQVIVGESPQIKEVWSLIEKFAPSDVTILLEGESGTGKELFARAIHEMSKRNQGPFVPVDCTALPEALAESEIFGYEKGAFTGAIERKAGRLEWAKEGTLFLDEISNLPILLQVKLLRAVQEMKISPLGAKGPKLIDLDVRIIVASNRKLYEMVQKGEFREDLYYRLSVVTIQIPPLREREGDIERLARHFLKSSSEKYGKSGLKLSHEALEILTSHSWPGNVRELENTIKSAVLMAENLILPQHLSKYLRPFGTMNPSHDHEEGVRLEVGMTLEIGKRLDFKQFRDRVVEEAEKELITRIIHRGYFKKSQLAEFLNIDPKTLRAKLKKFGLEWERGEY
ncbi:MAG: sigma-54-dependent Fis family transcriptional regulator [Candidatus Tectomicrobia bacterium]|nr:sigma-54-dependent Fis family transcriptional regulator [Candidatus Tectomicrobia bacterium]